jgi:acetyltransferase-like isoleucine patch superfamily enzyme
MYTSSRLFGLCIWLLVSMPAVARPRLIISGQWRTVVWGTAFPVVFKSATIAPSSGVTLKKLKIVLAALISLLPLNGLRVLGYRLLGYRIQNSRIGFGTIIAVDEAILESCKIGPFNLFAGPMKIHIHRGASIGNRNEFICGYWVLRAEYRDRQYARSLEVRDAALITSRHYFDLSGALILGERSWIAGVASQFWTHGIGVKERDIRIGSDCYIGSAARFSPGSSIGDGVVVAMGSVVSGDLPENNALIGGVPARVLKSDYNWKERNA